jgi:Inward rectifier potassium channel transmembrane domain/Inward rectifier potassium channel C-terminal domain
MPSPSSLYGRESALTDRSLTLDSNDTDNRDKEAALSEPLLSSRTSTYRHRDVSNNSPFASRSPPKATGNSGFRHSNDISYNMDATHQQNARFTDPIDPPPPLPSLMWTPISELSRATTDGSLGSHDVADLPTLTSIGNNNPLLLQRKRASTRLLDRQGAFGQSRGRWSVQHVSREEARHHRSMSGDASDVCVAPKSCLQRTVSCCCCCSCKSKKTKQQRMSWHKLFWNTWFYTLAYQRTIVLIMILFAIYTAIVVLFACLFYGISVWGVQEQVNPDGTTSKTAFCSMDIHNHMEALYFSLSTMATIGYGVSDYYFGGCWTPLLLVLAQVIAAIVFNAIAVGIIFQRISRGHKRSKTIVCSDKAVIRRVQGQLYFMFRIGELRHHFLLEATVRAYVVGHERYPVMQDDSAVSAVETTHYITQPLVLMHQSVSPHVLMSVPQVLVHRMDMTSPLRPRQAWCDARGMWHSPVSVVPPIVESGEGPNDMLKSPPILESQSVMSLELESYRDYWQDRSLEVIVLVEGTDELTGAKIQTRHSYTHADVAWNHQFVPCTRPSSVNVDAYSISAVPVSTMRAMEEGRDGEERGGGTDSIASQPRNSSVPACVVDYAMFHNVRPAPLDCPADPYIHG